MRACYLLALSLGLTCLTDAKLYGLELVHNSPAQPALITIDDTTGNMSYVGDGKGLNELAATGDLRAVDPKRGIYYFLGDTSAGTTLVGLSLKDGTQTCKKTVPQLKEIGFVGFGQSLNYDSKNDRLILSGVTKSGNVTGHTVLAASLTSPCGAGFSSLGTFADADFIPMLHSAALDVAGERLFVLVAPTKSPPQAIAIIDLKAGKMTKTDVDEGPAPADVLIGMDWDVKTSSLVGVMPDDKGGLLLLSLDPVTGKWLVKPVVQPDKPFGLIGGNEGTVNAFANGAIYVLVGNPSHDDDKDPEMHVAMIDIAGASMLTHPVLGKLGLGLLLNMVWV
jgi:hypothetical protein